MRSRELREGSRTQGTKGELEENPWIQELLMSWWADRRSSGADPVGEFNPYQ